MLLSASCLGPGNWYRPAPAEENIGSWGGTCTCPDGQVYEVGDTGNCASLACEGGWPSSCEREHKVERMGMKASCGMPLLCLQLCPEHHCLDNGLGDVDVVYVMCAREQP